MIFIAEGKKLGALFQDCRAVSEVYGQMLMISIVVLAFSGIAMTVYSDGGFVKPEHTPHIDLSDKIDTGSDTIQIVHSGGETINLDDIKVVLYVESPNQPEPKQQIFDMSDPLIANDPLIVRVFDPEGNPKDISTDRVVRLGDCIVIYTNEKINDDSRLKVGERINLQNEDLVSIFIVHIPSQQVIQKAVLQGGPWKLSYWITPHPYGSVYSSSDVWLPTESVSAINDTIFTNDQVPQRPNFVYQEFQFGIDADEMGISDNLTKVELKIIYRSPDCSPDEISLSIYNGSDWTTDPTNMTMAEYHTFGECDAANKVYDINLAPFYVNTTDKLENLKVKILGSGNAASTKFFGVDFIGIHVEF